MTQQAGYLTVAQRALAVAEVVDRKSRFIAQLAHVETEDEANAFIAQVRARRYDARHNVPAWILEDGRERQSDDGEPSRTSGLPTLDVLRAAGLKNVCCVTTRYFGGTLLGSGGLVRAYTAAAQAAVEEARAQGQLVEMTSVTDVAVTIPYASYDHVLHAAELAGAKVRDTSFTDCVRLLLAFKTGEEGAFLAQLKEMLNGEEVAEASPPSFAEF